MMKNLTVNKKSRQLLSISLKNKKDTFLPIIIVFCLPVLLYLQTLSFGFSGFDDNEIINNNITFLSDFSNAPKAFLTDAFIVQSSPYYRPMQTVSYMADIYLSNGNNIWMFHLINVLFLGLIASLLFLLLRKFLIPPKLAILSTLIFSVHPLFISSIAWIPARGDLLLSFFSMASFLFFIKYLQKKKIIYLFFNWLTFTIALFCKETAIFLPILFVIYYLTFSPEKRFEKKYLLYGLLYVISGVSWFWLRSIAIGAYSNQAEVGLTPFISNLQTIPESLTNFFLPFDIALIPSFSPFKTIVGLGIVLVIVVLFFNNKERSRKEKVFCLSWFFFLLVPAMLYKNEYVDYLSHRFFLPLIGILLYMLCIIPKKWLEKSDSRISLVMTVVVALISFVTFVKSRAYIEPMTFYNCAIAQNPHNALMYTNRGSLEVNVGNFQDAITDYTKAIALSPGYAVAYNNRGIAYSTIGDLDRAIKEFDKAIELKPNYVIAYNNRGFAYKNKGDLDKAIKDYDKAIVLNPKNADAYNNLGNNYQAKNDLDKAIKNYNKAIELNSNYANAYYNRGTAFSIKGDLDKGIRDFNIAIALNPNDAETYNNRGTAYSNLGYLDMAINDYDKAIELNPNYADAYNNRGNAYKNMGQVEKAEQDFKIYELLTKKR